MKQSSSSYFDDELGYSLENGYYFEENIIALTCIRVFGLISIVASGLIIYDIARKLCRRQGPFLKKVSLTQSILIVLSIGDFGGAFFVQVISTWMVPQRNQLLGSVGSQPSCVAQGILSGFFYNLSVLTNASLAVAYCMIVRCGWNDKDGSKVRLPFTLIPFLISIVTAVAPLFGQNYNYNGGYSCYISGAPPGCEFDPNPQETCVRGAQARMMLIIAGLLPVVIAFFIVFIAVLLLVYTVYVQERKMDRYQRSGRNRQLTMESFHQGIFYIGAFAISWTPWLVYGFREGTLVGANAVSYYVMLAVTPLHGLLNAIVYFRPRLKAERERNPNYSRCNSLMRVLNIKCCCNIKSRERNDETAMITADPAEGTERRNENDVTGDPKAKTVNAEAPQDAEIGSEKKAISTSS